MLLLRICALVLTLWPWRQRSNLFIQRSSFFFTAAPSAFYSKILLISWQFPRPCCTQNGVNSYRAEMLCRLFTANCPAMRSDCSTLISLSSSKQGLLLRAPQPPPLKQPGEAEKWQVPSAWKAYAQRWVCCRWHVAGGRGWPQMPRPRSGTTQSRERYQFQKHSNFRHVKFQTVGWSKFMRLPVYAPSLFAQFPPIKWSAAAPLRSGYPTTSLLQTENTSSHMSRDVIWRGKGWSGTTRLQSGYNHFSL